MHSPCSATRPVACACAPCTSALRAATAGTAAPAPCGVAGPLLCCAAVRGAAPGAAAAGRAASGAAGGLLVPHSTACAPQLRGRCACGAAGRGEPAPAPSMQGASLTPARGAPRAGCAAACCVPWCCMLDAAACACALPTLPVVGHAGCMRVRQRAWTGRGRTGRALAGAGLSPGTLTRGRTRCGLLPPVVVLIIRNECDLMILPLFMMQQQRAEGFVVP